MSQILLWNGAGNGTFEVPYTLVPDGTFDPALPFSIKVTTAEVMTPHDFMYFKIPALYATTIFKLAIFYNDINPEFTIVSENAHRYTVFNGNDNLDLVDGPYILVNYQNTHYLLKQQIFTIEDMIPYHIELLERDTVRESEDSESVKLTIDIGTDPDLPGRKIKADVVVNPGVDNILEITPEGVMVSKVQPEFTLRELKMDDGNGNIAIFRYTHTNGNHYQVVDIVYPDGRVAQINEENYRNFRSQVETLLNSGHVIAGTGVSLGENVVNGVLYSPTGQYRNNLLGVVTVDAVAKNAKSKVTFLGIVTGISTSTLHSSGVPYVEGQTMWAVENGQMSNVPLAKPAMQVRMGMIINVQGSLVDVLVCPEIFRLFDDLSNVTITNPQNRHIAIYQDGLWVNTDALIVVEGKVQTLEQEMDAAEDRIAATEGRLDDAEVRVDFAEGAIENLQTNKVDKIQTIIGLALSGNITLENFKIALGNATQAFAGLMSPEDKANIDTLMALLGPDADNVADTIRDILALFENYPEGATMLEALAGKVDKVAGKALSTNDYDNVEKNKVAQSELHGQTVGNPHGTKYAELVDKPTTIEAAGIGNVYNKTHVDAIDAKAIAAKAHADMVGSNPHQTKYSQLVDKPVTIEEAGILNVYNKLYIDALKDQNGWESELLTLTPLAPSGTIATATLLLYNSLRLQVKNTSTSFVDTDTVEVSLGVVTGNKIQLSDTSVYLEIGATNSTFVAPAGWTLQIVGLKYTDLVASDVATDEVGVSVQDKLDTIESKKANRYIDEPIAELNGHTLREVFEGGNLLLNPNFDDTSNWTLRTNTTQNVTNGINRVTAIATSTAIGIQQNTSISNTNIKYSVVKVKPYFNTLFTCGYVGSQTFTVVLNEWNNLSMKSTVGVGDTVFRLIQDLSNGQYFDIDYAYSINQTTLGISALTVQQMDYWFNVWQQYRYDNGLKSTVDGLQALKEKDSEIELKVTTIEEAYRKSQNGELTATKFDTDNISLGKDVAPAPLQVKVDGGLLEAKQLLLNPNMNDTSNWTSIASTSSVTNGILSNTGDGTSSASHIQQTLSLTGTVKLYLVARLRVTNSVATSIRLRDASDVAIIIQNTPVQNQWYTLSVVNSVGDFRIRVQHNYIDATTANGKVMEVDYAYAFNISTLIANKQYSPLYNKTFDTMSDAEIKAQMDLWVQNGTLPNDNVLAVGMNKRVRSVGKNLFDGRMELGGVTSNDGTNYVDNARVRTVGFIPVKPSTVYAFSQNGTLKTANIRYYNINKTFISAQSVQTFTTPNNAYFIRFDYASDFTNTTNLQLELGSTATSYVPYANTDLYLQANKVGYKVRNVADSVDTRNGKYYYTKGIARSLFTNEIALSFEPAATNTTHAFFWTQPLSPFMNGAKSVANDVIGNILSYPHFKPYDYGQLAFGAGTTIQGVAIGNPGGGSGAQMGIRIEKNNLVGWNDSLTNTEKVALAKNYLVSIGFTLFYELATPIETEILALGNAQGLAGGTTYIDDIMADSNLYTSKYDIENTAYPIKYLDRIVKINADGSQTELAVSSATVAVGGLSFTHPSLVANDIVWIAYTYNVANLFKSNTFVTYYDNPFIAVQPNGTPRRIVFTVNDSGVVTVSSVAV